MANKTKKTKAEETVDEMLRLELIGEDDIEPAKVIMTWMYEGSEEAEKVNKEMCDNLRENGFAKDDKLLADLKTDESFVMWFSLAIAGIHGYIEQVEEG